MSFRRIAVALLATFVTSGVIGVVIAENAAAATGSITLTRGGRDTTVPFTTAQAGDVEARLTVSG